MILFKFGIAGFFITDEREDFVHFGFLDCLGDGRIGLRLGYIGNPQRDCLW
jgi:hypothetical protein